MTTKTDEQERRDFEAWAKEHHYSISTDDDGNYANFETIDAWEGWQARAALQSQDREDSGKLQEAARDIFVRASEIEVLYGTNKETEGLVMAAMRLAYLVGPTEKAIDHARRIEGGSHEPI